MSHSMINTTVGGNASTSLGPFQNSSLGSNTSTPLEAFQANSLGVGFSGSGFLILYFTGVSAVLQSLGIINNSTKLAGSSGGALTAAALCSDAPAATDQLTTNLNIAAICRSTFGCRGSLGPVVRASFSALIENTGNNSAAEITPQCRENLYVTVTRARPNNQTDLPVLLSNFTSQTQLVDGVTASAFLPFWSAPGPVTQFEGLAVYDGGFSFPLPCPPDVAYCITVSSSPPQAPPVPSAEADNETDSTLNVLTAAANRSDLTTRVYLPLNPEVLPAPAQPDIYPGLSSPLNVTVQEWESWAFVIPDNSTLLSIYNQGRKDAAYWAVQAGLADSQSVQNALAVQPAGFGGST